MANKKRLSIPGAIHYIYAQSINECPLFADIEDRLAFLNLLHENLNITGYKCLKYELSNYFYKLVIKVNHLPLGNLFRRLNSFYALRYNRRHSREGHLFNRRFRSVVLDDSYKNEILNYLSATETQQTGSSIINNSIQTISGLQSIDQTLTVSFKTAKMINNEAKEMFYSLMENEQDNQFENPFTTILENINHEIQNRYDPNCWSIGKKAFMTLVMSDLQKEYKAVADYTLTDWTLDKLRDFILSRTDTSIEDFWHRGRLNNQSSARKLFSYFSVRELGYRIADIKKFLKVSGTAVSKLAKKGFSIARSLNILLPSNCPEYAAEILI